MADGTRIEWTEATWNPVAGCSKISAGCAHCYAERLSLRFGRSAAPWTPANARANVVLHPERLPQPLRWRRPRMIFVNSMSDLFHELVPLDFVAQVFAVMALAPRHTFQVLTKRPELALQRFREGLDAATLRAAAQLASAGLAEIASPPWPLPNVWLGVSIENARFTARADALRELPAAVRFISAEPLLGSLFEAGGRKNPLELRGIDWLIAGGESGIGARPMQISWARELRDACADAGVAFFFKQWGGRTPKSGGRELDGRHHNALPISAIA